MTRPLRNIVAAIALLTPVQAAPSAGDIPCYQSKLAVEPRHKMTWQGEEPA